MTVPLGYKNLSADELVEFKIHGVDAGFIERMQDKGFKDLSEDELLRIKIHGLDEILDRRSST